MKYVSVVPPYYIPPRSGPIFPISSCSLPYGVEEPCGSNSFVVWTSSIFIFIPVFVMFVSWDERIALVNSALCHAYIYMPVRQNLQWTHMEKTLSAMKA